MHIESFNNDIEKNKGTYSYNNGKLANKFIINKKLKTILSVCDLKNKNVLEIGCGDGVFSSELANTVDGINIFAVDPADKAIFYAKKLERDNLKFEVMNIYDININKKFDYVLFNEVIHHLENTNSALEIASKYANNILIIEKNTKSIFLKIHNIIKKIKHRKMCHHKHSKTSIKNIKKYLSETLSMNIKNTKYMNIMPLFCSDNKAKIIRCIEPIFETIPILNMFTCKNVLIYAIKK